jgi:predicted AlkP superfamily pyrophosphatase or phosphodiesterase
MNNGIIYGEPISEIKNDLKGKKPKAAIMFIIDGCKADTLYDAIKNGSMPKLKAFMEDVGYKKYENCFTVFPSVTITCHASIVTGTLPGHHGIVGNDWFIRKKWGLFSDKEKNKRDELYKVTREYVKYSWKHPFSDPGLANGLFTGSFFGIANSDLYHQIKTIYEAYNNFIERHHSKDRSMSIFEMITRGADESKFIDIDDIGGLGGKILGIINWIRSKFSKKIYLSFPNNGMDCRAFDELLDVLDERERKRPEVFIVWLPGMDGFSHKNGASCQPEYFKDKGKLLEFFVGDLDDQFDKLRHRLKKEKLLDDVLIAITADHGQYDCSDKLGISNEMLYHYLKFNEEASQNEIFPLTDYGKVDKDCKDASVIVIGNGGACYIYVKADEGWSKPPTITRMEKFLKPLQSFMGTDKVFVRYSNKEYRHWQNGKSQKIDDSLNSKEYPFAAERINNLANTLRGGDIILTTKKPFYYAGESMRGEHGSLHREDSHVPLIFINKNLQKQLVTKDVRTIDISPTIAESMGFLKNLRKKGTHKDKLLAILDTLDKRYKSKIHNIGLEKILNKIDSFSEENRIRRDWAVEEIDMKNNFKFKVKHFLKEEGITDKEYDELKKKYDQIISTRRRI